jgi:branched-chain amino acid transport system permease protein
MGISFISVVRRSASFAVRADEDKARRRRGHGGQAVASARASATAMVGGVWAYYVGFITRSRGGSAARSAWSFGDVSGGQATLWGPVISAFILVPAQQYRL